MRTLSFYTMDEMIERWKEAATKLDASLDPFDAGKAQGYRVAAAELSAIVAASMEIEAAHHGDPEPSWASYGVPVGETTPCDPPYHYPACTGC